MIDFQEKRAVFGHSFLKNGVIMRFPEESKNFILGRTTSESTSQSPTREITMPEKVSQNLEFAALGWLRGFPPDWPSAATSLRLMLDSSKDIQNFSPSDTFETLETSLIASANQCLPSMKAISGRRLPEKEEWQSCLEGLKRTFEGIQSMEGSHSEFSKWFRSTLMIVSF